MNYGRISMADLYALGHLRCNGSQYFIGGKRIDAISTGDGEYYKYERGSRWYSTLRKAVNDYGSN